MERAWDDVNEWWELPIEKVKAARAEEISYMEGQGIWTVRPVTECWEKTGRKPVSVRWVDTDKGYMGGGGKEGTRIGMIYLRGVRHWRRSGYC